MGVNDNKWDKFEHFIGTRQLKIVNFGFPPCMITVNHFY